MAALARRLMTGVAVLAGTSAGAGLLLWGVLWWPLSSRSVVLMGAGATLVVLLAPAAVLGLFYQGLHDLRALPDRVSERTARTAEQSVETARAATTDAPAGLFRRLWYIVKEIWSLRTVLTENRAMLVRYSALLRFVTPGFLLLVAVAAGVSVVLVPVAAAAGLIVLLW